MDINEIVEIVSDVYPDGLVAQCWDFKKKRPIVNPGVGDTLAEFIAYELENADSEEDKLEAALRMMETAKHELELVCGALQVAIDNRLENHAS